MKLWCMFVGKKPNVFSVKIDASEDVDDLKKTIKEVKGNALKTIDADELELYVARTSDGNWVKDDASGHATVRLDQNGHPTPSFQHMHRSWRLDDQNLFGEVVTAEAGYIHVLVVVPEPSSSEGAAAASMLPMVKEAVETAVTAAFKNERDRQRSEVSISACTRSHAQKVLDQLGFDYDNVQVTEEKDDSIPPYRWIGNVAEDHVTQREKYMQYFREHLRGVLHQDGNSETDTTETEPSDASPHLHPQYHLKDTSQTKSLLTCDIPGTLPFKLKGTTDMMIIDEAAETMNNVFAGLHFVIEVKKERGGVAEQSQVLCELVPASLMSDKRCSPVGLLTNLTDYWYFVWITEGRTVTRMTIKNPVNAFAMIKYFLVSPTELSARETTKRFQFSTPPPKRQKLTKITTGDDLAAAEMMERYELMADELDPAFLLQRRVEYELRLIREMPIHTGMYS